ncbi:MAG: thioredoxin family protein [Candidatus Thorarchaeota archaeon]|jgi:thiol-disulfide isomerase/thioredoxin
MFRDRNAMADLDDIRKRTKTARDYVETMEGKARDQFLEFYDEYKLDQQAIDELKHLIKGLTFVVMSAGWCKDCRFAVPVLMYLEEEIGLDVRCFGGIKTAPLDPDHQWRIPPSPPEMEDWGVTAIPWIEIFSSKGDRVGVIIEKPKVKPTLEAELVHVLKEALA